MTPTPSANAAGPARLTDKVVVARPTARPTALRGGPVGQGVREVQVGRSTVPTGAVTLTVTVPDARTADVLQSLLPLTAADAFQQATDREAAIAALVADGGRLRAASPAGGAQAYRNAKARVDLAAEFPLLSGGQVAAAAQSGAANAHATASRWRTKNRVFAIPDSVGLLYPSFQFDHRGRPLPVMAALLAQLQPALDGWQLALWFTTATSRLGGLRPVDVLDSDDPTDHGLLLAAARAQAADILNPAW